VQAWCPTCNEHIEAVRDLPLETHLLFLIAGAVLGGLAGFAVAALWPVDPHYAVPIAAAVPVFILGIARALDRKLCPTCKSEVDPDVRGD
jgi:hypothetical protein